MSALVIIIEILAYIFIFYYLVECDFTPVKSRIFISGMISLIWLYLQSLFKIPFSTIYNAVVIGLIIILLFQDCIHFKVTWVIICTVIENLLSYIICHSIGLMNDYILHNETILNIASHYIDCFLFLLVLMIAPMLGKSQWRRTPLLCELHSGANYFICSMCLFLHFALNFSEYLFAGMTNKTLLHHLEVFSVLLALFSGMSILFILKMQYENMRLNQLFSINQKALSLEKQQYQLIKENNQSLRAFRHDINGHILALQTYAWFGEQDKLYEYINHLSTIQKSFHSFATENIIVDAILNQAAQALDDTTTFKVSGLFPPECFMEDMDLCIIFTNLLNNAVEALKKLDSHISKELYVEIHNVTQEIQITVTNSSMPYNFQELHHLTTAKSDKTNHGFGLSNIQRIVKKYHGDLIVHYSNGLFSTCVSCKYVY